VLCGAGWGRDTWQQLLSGFLETHITQAAIMQGCHITQLDCAKYRCTDDGLRQSCLKRILWHFDFSVMQDSLHATLATDTCCSLHIHLT
jgi:hypothetical protein